MNFIVTDWQLWEKDGWQRATSKVYPKHMLKAGKVTYCAVGIADMPVFSQISSVAGIAAR